MDWNHQSQPPPEEGGDNTAENAGDSLTSIAQSIHCATTSAQAPGVYADDEIPELDQLDIENFITVLAEVALAIATRQPRGSQGSASRTIRKLL